MKALESPLQGQLAQCSVSLGEWVSQGQVLMVLEAMKMEHELRAPSSGLVTELWAQVGEMVQAGQTLLLLDEHATPAVDASVAAVLQAQDANGSSDNSSANASTAASIRDDLKRFLHRQAQTLDANRPEAMDKRHQSGQRSARELIAQLCEPGSFQEYGALAVAAQTQRRAIEDLIQNTPADGMVTGLGRVGLQQVVVMAYDATVLAGTQGFRNHQKTDRLLDIAWQHRLPVVLFAEGGGGRPGDTDMPIVAGLHVSTFAHYAKLRGRVPVLAVANGRCFAGNAALLGCSDLIIATERSNIGMGGPAMIEGGGLGSFKPEDIGPASVQHRNGVIDVLVADETAAVEAAKHLLSLLTQPQLEMDHKVSAPELSVGAFADERGAVLRAAVPENRLRVYDSGPIVQALADDNSVVALKTAYGVGIHTCLARIGGQACGIMANNPLHLGGAIDAEAAHKAAEFMHLCARFRLPLISLIDTPGFMVGPEAEAQGQVKFASQMFIAAAHYLQSAAVPFVAVVLRKGYGLGAMAMAAGGFHAPLCTVAWPSAEFGAMGLEGAVRLGYRKELQACASESEREALFQQLLAEQIEKGSAINMAQTLELDAVIDPADTRAWIERCWGNQARGFGA
jgi:acetyl-CoA carboxylase carboxyltransferase component